MAYIEIDARGCGAGKTTQNIIPRILRNSELGIRTVVVVPSIRLQEQYKTAIPSATIINSERTKNTNEAFHTSMNAGDRVIVITHQAFLNNINISTSERYNTDLIIDEAFDPYNLEILTLTDSQGRAYFKFAGVFELDKRSDQDEIINMPENMLKTNKEWYKIRINKTKEIPSLLSGSVQWNRLTNLNRILWATARSSRSLIDGDSSTVQIVTELDPDILVGYYSVLIAAAAFERTFLAQWIVKNNLSASILPGCDFVPHRVNLRLHMPAQEIRWSKSLRNSHPELVNAFVDFVSDCVKDQPVIYVKNNDSDDICLGTSTQRIDHNAHGVNAFADYKNYAQLSALQPNAYLMSFYVNHLGMNSEPKTIDTTGKRNARTLVADEGNKPFYYPQVVMAFSGYMTYQLLMRTHLRNSNQGTDWVDVYLMDTCLGMELLDLFDPEYYQVEFDIPIRDPRGSTRKKPGRKPGTKIKDKPLSNSERQRLYRARQKELKQSQLLDCNSDTKCND